MKPYNDTIETLRLFGLASFRNEQIKPIEALRKCKNVFVNAPTSSGKSLIYQLPAVLHQEQLTIVIEPTISLMLDQVQKLNRLGFSAAHLDSSLTKAQKQDVLARLDKLTFLYTTPEQMIRPDFMKQLKHVRVYQIVVDEAHCVLDWGYSFRGAYLELGSAIKAINPQCVSAFTATASPADEVEIQKLLGVAMKVFRCKFDRKNLIFSKREADSRKEKLHLVKKYLKKYDPHRAVVYCNTHKAVDAVAADLHFLYEPLLSSRPFATVEEMDETLIRNWNETVSPEDTVYLVGDLGYNEGQVATSAFGMGIDLPDIELVIHFNMPLSMNDYIQQTGRAGRDGGKAHCILLYSSEDFWMASALVEPYENTRLNESLQQMMAYCEDRKHCLKHLMLEALGQAAGKKCRFCTNCQAGRL